MDVSPFKFLHLRLLRKVTVLCQSVGQSTREIVRQIELEEFKQKVMEESALLPEAIDILNYWSKRTITGLLLMPPTRHNVLHL